MLTYFRNLRIGGKMFVLFGLMLGIMVGVGFRCTWSLVDLSNDYHSLIRTNERIALLGEQMDVTFLQQVHALKNTLLRGSEPANFDKYTKQELRSHG